MEEQPHFTPEEIDLYLISRALWNIEEKRGIDERIKGDFYELDIRIGEMVRARRPKNRPSVRPSVLQIIEHIQNKYLAEPTTESDAISGALEIAMRFGSIDGEHHKAWVIDQMCRALLGAQYESFIAEAKAGEDGLDTYEWDVGTPP